MHLHLARECRRSKPLARPPSGARVPPRTGPRHEEGQRRAPTGGYHLRGRGTMLKPVGWAGRREGDGGAPLAASAPSGRGRRTATTSCRGATAPTSSAAALRAPCWASPGPASLKPRRRGRAAPADLARPGGAGEGPPAGRAEAAILTSPTGRGSRRPRRCARASAPSESPVVHGSRTLPRRGPDGPQRGPYPRGRWPRTRRQSAVEPGSGCVSLPALPGELSHPLEQIHRPTPGSHRDGQRSWLRGARGGSWLGTAGSLAKVPTRGDRTVRWRPAQDPAADCAADRLRGEPGARSLG